MCNRLLIVNKYNKLKEATFQRMGSTNSRQGEADHISDYQTPLEKPERCHKLKSLFKWLGLLSAITDEELKVICGTDGALYLVFNRYAAQFFAILSIFNAVFFIPLYVTGSNSGEEMYNKSKQFVQIFTLTLLHIRWEELRVIVVFTVMIVVYTFMAFWFMRNYWRKSIAWRHKEHSHKTKFMDSDIAMHSIMVTGIDQSIPLEVATQTVRTVFERLFNGGKIISVKVIGQMDKLFHLAKHLREHKKLLRYYKKKNRQHEEAHQSQHPAES